MLQPSKTMKLAINLAKKMLAKYRNHYQERYNQDLPIILVAGTAGKSSTTLLLKNLFLNDGWKVFSGAKEEMCLNSVTGLSMVLGEFESDFEGRGATFQKILFILRGYIELARKKLDLPQKTILIYEIGFNEQNESEFFTQIFPEDSAQLLVLTNLAHEHSFGFNEEFDKEAYNKIKDNIPPHWHKKFDDESIDGVLKNIALEQFKLVHTSKQYIIPTTIGSFDNGVITNISGRNLTYHPKVTRNKNFALEVNKMQIGKDLLLPLTFAKNAYITSQVAKKFDLPQSVVKTTLENIHVPNGRFSLLNGVNGTKIVDSTYNSDPASLSGFLDLFEEVCGNFITQSRNGELPEPYGIAPKHTIILGEMRELGDSAKQAHTEIIEKLIKIMTIYGDYIQDLFLIGEEWHKVDDHIVKYEDNVRFISHKNHMFKVYSRAGDINKVLTDDYIRSGEWFWIKGSQNTIFLEIVVKHLLADKSDTKRLCRQGSNWDLHRKKFE